MVEENNLITPSDYFNEVKERKNKVDDSVLDQIYDNCLTLLNKYKRTGQIDASKKLIFHLESVEKERELVKKGIDTYVFKDDIEEFIDNVAGDSVKISELERYERDIPDEIVQVIEEVGDLFDQLYVVYTDYTGKEEKKIKEERRSKDPILFGTFQDNANSVIIERFYFLGDWEDEYCDLTLDKMINEFNSEKNKNIERKIETPDDIKELKNQLYELEPTVNGNFKYTGKKVDEGFFSKVKSILTGRE